MTNLGNRIIVLIDMDCFFCQVESRLQPDLQGKPVAVVQYNQWRNGGIIAVNYEARNFGVTRHMRGDEAKEKCPDIVLVSVPSLRGKADGSKYRSAGREVVDVLKKHCSVIERASVDEAYLDITELVDKTISAAPTTKRDSMVASLTNTFVVGYCDDESNDEEQRTEGVERWIDEAFSEFGDAQAIKLAAAGAIVNQLRAEIYETTKFRCSAGISYNKILAKLTCGLHKPNRQTILPAAAVPSLYSTLPVNKVRNLGGKFGGIVMESLACNVMADLMRYSLNELQKRFDDKTGCWLYNIARGIDNEPVTNRLVCKSIGSSKNFPGKQAIVKLEVLKNWVNELSLDVADRLEQDLEENERRATTITVSFHYYEDRKVISQSRSCPLKSYKPEKIAQQSIDLITKSTHKPIAHIGIAAGKFVQAKGSGNFVNFFKAKPDDADADATSAPNQKTCTKPSTSSAVPPEATFVNLFKNHRAKPDISAIFANPSDENVDGSKSEEASQSFFAKQVANNEQDLKGTESISPSTAILGSTRLNKLLNRENLQNSFFMNFLKDSKSESAISTEEPATRTFVRQKHEECDDEKLNPSEEIPERDLAQLREIFPDLDNIDRNVVKLLPMQLQRLANSYIKENSPRKIVSVKNSSKATKALAKRKIKLSATSNSLQNFVVKTDSSLQKCAECNQMIQLEKYSEHKDFHVAYSLQRTMNQRSIEKPFTASSSSLKRRLSDETSKPGKKTRTISSFFIP